MRKFLFGFIATILLGSLTANAQLLSESAVIKTGSRVLSKAEKDKSARTFTIINFNKNYKLLTNYNLNGVDFTDDGKYNDVKAGDGIYTSTALLPNLKKTSVSYYFMSDDFKYKNELNNTTSKASIKVGCKMRHVKKGFSSLLGLDCSKTWGGCIEFYDCEFSFEFEW